MSSIAAAPPRLASVARALFDPRSIAVVGASDDSGKWGYLLAELALRGAHRRAVYLVNPTRATVQGRRAYPSLACLPESPELVVLGVPADRLEMVAVEALDIKARVLVAIAAGFSERSGAGAEVERRLAARVRAEGAALLGPNCMGVYDASSALDLAPWFAPASALPPGDLDIVSQSGNLGSDIARLAWDAGLGVRRFLSVGNQADIEVADALELLAADEETRIVGLYVEDFRDGRRFAAAAADAARRGKLVLLLTVGRQAAAVAAHSHTGSLVSDSRLVGAVCAASGIVRVSSPTELVELATICRSRPRVRGRRLAIVSDGGGHGVVAAELAEQHGLVVPALSPELERQVRERAPGAATIANPVDLVAASRDPMLFPDIATLLLGPEGFDVVLVTGNLGGFSTLNPHPEVAAAEMAAAERLAELPSETGRAVCVQSIFVTAPACARLRANGIPVTRDSALAIRAIAALAARAETLAWPLDDPVVVGRLDFGDLGYLAARAAAESLGITVPPVRSASSAEAAVAAARDLGFPVALKTLGAVHKSDDGGVALGLGDERAVERAYVAIAGRLGPRIVVERMVDEPGVEMIVGARRDRRFGPVAVVGIGGIFTEILDDTAVALAPLSQTQAERLIRSLRSAPLLMGARGRPAVDVGAAARVLTLVAAALASSRGLGELEINPLLVTHAGAVALDVRGIPIAREGVFDGPAPDASTS
jgi:acetate---CoA ligase (ADP-forming)